MTEPLDLAGLVDNFVHEPTQVHDGGIDLTVSAIYRVDEPGRIDFGGDEQRDAGLSPLETVRHDADDAYEWWHLEAGQYVIQYNEFLVDDDGIRLYLQPRNELLARGGIHPSLHVERHLPLVPLSVPDGGLEVKENARLSTLVLPDRSGAPAAANTVSSDRE